MAERAAPTRAETRLGWLSLHAWAALTAAAFVLLIVVGILPRFFW